MNTEGINTDVLVVVIRKARRMFRYGKRTFADIGMGAFGFDRDSTQVPITVYRKYRNELQYHETMFCAYVGGHQDGPVLRTNNGTVGGSLVAADFKVGDRILIAGHQHSPSKELLSLFTR